MTAPARPLDPPGVPYALRRRLALAGALFLVALPLGVFWAEVGGLSHYFSAQYPPGQGAYIMMRAAGHLAFVLLFLQLVLGSNVRAIARWVGRPSLLRLHRALGGTTLAVALLHPILFLWARTLRSGLFEPLKVILPPPGDYYHNRLLLGAVCLYLLMAAIAAAIYGPRLLPRVWRRVHLLNYAAFFGLWLHAFSIGSETRHPVLVVLYGAMVVLVIAFGLRRLLGAIR